MYLWHEEADSLGDHEVVVVGLNLGQSQRYAAPGFPVVVSLRHDPAEVVHHRGRHLQLVLVGLQQLGEDCAVELKSCELPLPLQSRVRSFNSFYVYY